MKFYHCAKFGRKKLTNSRGGQSPSDVHQNFCRCGIGLVLIFFKDKI